MTRQGQTRHQRLERSIRRAEGSCSKGLLPATKAKRPPDNITLAFTLWGISNTNNPKGSITHEIMIWSANRGGTPAGTKRGTLRVSGVNFDVYVNPNQSDNSGANQSQWTYVVFVAQAPLLKGQLDLDLTTGYLPEQGIMADNTFLTSLELGTEMSGGEGKAEVLDYAVTVAGK